jgi:putative nucleotidyltransferase with HDIG domain
MFESRSNSRRAVIREKCPDVWGNWWRDFQANGGLRAVGIAAAFCVLAVLIVMLREDVVPYRPGQYVPQAILSRVEFTFRDKAKLAEAKKVARESEPRVYRYNPEVWSELQENLLALPDKLAGHKISELPRSLQDALETADHSGDVNALYTIAEAKPDSPTRTAYAEEVKKYVERIQQQNLLIVSDDDYRAEWDSIVRRNVSVPGRDPKAFFSKGDLYPVVDGDVDEHARYADLRQNLEQWAAVPFPPPLAGRIVAYTLHTLKPTLTLDPSATAEAQNNAVARVQPYRALRAYKPNETLVERGSVLTERDWQVLKAEKQAFIASLGIRAVKSKLGLASVVVLLTALLSYYVAVYQPRIVQKPARAVAIAALLLAMLLLAQLAAVGTGPLYVFGIAPTILVAMILAIAYDQRFAIGVASMHGILVTAALDQSVEFFLILWVGVFTCGFLLDEVRTRSKLIEVGGITAIAMIGATVAGGAVNYDPINYIAMNCLYTGAAGLAVGFIVLGILPFIEKAFGITTGMTLLELADASQPLLRRLSLEAPGTYNHSLQVATLAETAAEAIQADSLLTRVAAYYHDIGKINKADYFVENQTDGRNRHIHLTPNMSFHIITGHVKDGVALAKEYNLPPEIIPFIQQHHGTTLIEYFFDKAKKQHDQFAPNSPDVSEMQFRYAGPKPRTKEIAILMLADAAESASRTLEEPTPAALEKLVHNLAMKRLLDGQFDDCDLTMRELELIEKSLHKTLTGIYHGRIAYPSETGSSGGTPATPTQPAPAAPTMKLA